MSDSSFGDGRREVACLCSAIGIRVSAESIFLITFKKSHPLDVQIVEQSIGNRVIAKYGKSGVV